MIITCPSCKKKFNLDINLITSEGRNLQCGTCDHIWFYKKKNQISLPPQINEDIAIKENENIEKLNYDKPSKKLKKDTVEDHKEPESESIDIKVTESKPDLIKKNKSSKFFSYLLVLIISLGAIIILLDTLKTPLINIFPGLELLVFNLYETLKDIKLFIIDLS